MPCFGQFCYGSGAQLRNQRNPPATCADWCRGGLFRGSEHEGTVAGIHACDDFGTEMIDKDYVEAISLIERAHRSFLAVIKLELDDLEVRDINNVQAMMLFNIGDARMTVGELITRGCYLGSNVSYNLKKLIGYEYIVQERSTYDRRAT